jgi:hypothetical protein
MLTVKHMEITGHENIYPAVRVSYQPRQRADGSAYDAQDPNASSDDIAACVFIDTPKGDTVCLGSWGAFYVMNDAGKTVAKYDLGGWPVPQVKAARGLVWSAGMAEAQVIS